jgi:hypothetical protein
MTVDGMLGNSGKLFTNVELLAKDSLYIFIETTAKIADANPTDLLYTDQIEFDSGANLQTVELVTLIQDAVYIQNDLLMELQKVYQLVKKNLWFYLDEMIQLTETNCISQKQTLRNIWLRRSSLK